MCERERAKSLKFHKKSNEIETRMNALYKTRKRTLFLERRGEGRKKVTPVPILLMAAAVVGRRVHHRR
jgi:hypothetical protein